MNKEPKQPFVTDQNLFDEIDMDPIEMDPIEVAAEEAAAVEETIVDDVQWVVMVDDNRLAQNETAQSTPPATRELIEKEALIPTRKLNNQQGNSLLEKPDISPDKDTEDVEEIKRMLAEIEKLEQKEVQIDSKPLPPPEKPKVSEDTSSVNIQKLLEELNQLEHLEENKSSKPLSQEKPKAGPSRNSQRLSLPELDSLDQKEPVRPARSQESSDKAKPVQESERTKPEDVQKLLAELDSLEQKEATKPSRSQIAPSKPKQTAPLNSDDNTDLKRTLAEMSFLEGNGSLSQGDRSGAIVHYRDAINYAPDRADYYIKLADVLGQEINTRPEAEQLLTKAIELSHGNLELRSKLAELRGELPPTPKRGTQNLSKAAAQAGAQEQKEKTTKLSRIGFIKGEGKNLPKRISLLNKVILFLFFGALAWGVIHSMRGEPIKIRVKLLLPLDEASITLDHVELSWQATGDKFKIQMEENGIPVMERTSVETRYSLPPQDLSLLKPDRRYTWRVIPLKFNDEVIPNVTDDFHFRVAPLNKAKKGAESTAERTKSVEFSQKRIGRTKKPNKKSQMRRENHKDTKDTKNF